jgi:hypothetical protein
MALAMFLTVCSPRSAKASESLTLIWSLAAREIYTPPGSHNVCSPRGDIDTVTENVVAVDDVAHINADAKDDAVFFRHVGIAAHDAPLDRHGAGHRVDNAGEFDQRPVARRFDDATTMRANHRISQFAAMPL